MTRFDVLATAAHFVWCRADHHRFSFLQESRSLSEGWPDHRYPPDYIVPALEAVSRFPPDIIGMLRTCLAVVGVTRG